MPDEHKATIRTEQDGDRHRAFCRSCSWEDERAYSYPGPALRAAEEHRQEAGK